ncbi:MAG: hypothetical protein WKG01_16220 [Kofleriaceae bacterium]
MLGTTRILLLMLATACGSSSTDECAEDQVEVAYLGGARDGESFCLARPASCANPATCDDACRGAMYDLCEAPYNGVACSDTFAPPIISCNP